MRVISILIIYQFLLYINFYYVFKVYYVYAFKKQTGLLNLLACTRLLRACPRVRPPIRGEDEVSTKIRGTRVDVTGEQGYWLSNKSI